VQFPGVLGSLPSRLRTVGVPKALLQLGGLLVQLLGAAVGGKLTCPRSRSTFPCSRHPVRFVAHVLTNSGVAVQFGPRPVNWCKSAAAWFSWLTASAPSLK